MRAAPLGLRNGDRDRLTARTRSSTVRAGLAQRTRIVLLAADGISHTEIAERLGVSRQTVITWRGRYERSGLAGLDDRPRSGRPRTVDHDRIITATLTPPPKRLGVTHWSSRLLATKLKIDHATVARAWKDYGVQPWRSETFKFSTDPELVAKVTDVVGRPPNAGGVSSRNLGSCRGVVAAKRQPVAVGTRAVQLSRRRRASATSGSAWARVPTYERLLGSPVCRTSRSLSDTRGLSNCFDSSARSRNSRGYFLGAGTVSRPVESDLPPHLGDSVPQNRARGRPTADSATPPEPSNLSSG